MKIATLLSAGSLVAVGAAGAVGVMTLANAQPAATELVGQPAAGSTYVPASYARSSAANYTVDGVHSGVVFRIIHAGAAPFYGMFTGLSGDMTIDPSDPSATRINVEIDTTKVATGNDNRDDHLRSADFFNARQFPTATFSASGGKAAGNGSMEIEGELTMLGVTKSVTATMTPTGEGQFRNSTRAGFETTLTFKRSDFGMTAYIDQGTLGDEIQLIVFIEGIEQ
ncbi:MAG: YceI family protein [Planctomycetota bacterium]